MRKRPAPRRRPSVVKRAPAPRPAPVPPPPKPRLALPAPRSVAATRTLTPGLRVVAWVFIFGGFAGLMGALGGALVFAHDPAAFAPEQDTRFGLVVGASGVLALDGLAVAAGVQLLGVREWGRLASVVISTVGLFGCAVALAVAYFGGFLTESAPAPAWVVGFALVGTLSAAIFFGWSLPVLVDGDTVALFRSESPTPAAWEPTE